ncbi:MAG TPA: c-type cytochrome, partial [Planctomycetaceae bacterium]|nr:c-type cytochrome [Planctomycetaceae bacterium]
RPFYRSGDDRGRIYRIVRKGQAPRRVLDFTRCSTEELVSLLETPNGPQRDLVQQLLIARRDSSAVPLLEKLARTSGNPLARLHALCTLDGLDALSSQLLRQALADRHPGVRRHAVRLAESRVADDRELLQAALELVDDPGPKVRLQLAYSLGEWPGKAVADALARLALRDGGDPYLTAAVMSSLNKYNLRHVLAAILRQRRHPAAAKWTRMLLSQAVAFQDWAAVRQGLVSVFESKEDADFAWQCDVVAAVLDALQRHRFSLERITKGETQEGARLRERIVEWTRRARSVVSDERQSVEVRQAAIGLLARETEGRQEDWNRLAELLSPQTPVELQRAAVRRLADLPDSAVARLLLQRWSSSSPALRSEVLSVLLTRRPWLTALLDAIEQRQVAPADIDARTRQSLLGYPDKTVRTRAAQLLAGSGNPDRRKVLKEYQIALKLKGDPKRGQAVFAKTCASCHKLDGVGHEIGPNLRSLSDRRPKSLLTSILDPSASVDGKYVTYV